MSQHIALQFLVIMLHEVVYGAVYMSRLVVRHINTSWSTQSLCQMNITSFSINFVYCYYAKMKLWLCTYGQIVWNIAMSLSMQGIHALECSYLAYQNFILMKEILTKVMKFFLTRVLLLFLVSISNGQTTFGIMDSGKGFCTKSSS